MLFSVREGRKISGCVGYFPSLGTDISIFDAIIRP